jgi:hypothetical protein
MSRERKNGIAARATVLLSAGQVLQHGLQPTGGVTSAISTSSTRDAEPSGRSRPSDHRRTTAEVIDHRDAVERGADTR